MKNRVFPEEYRHSIGKITICNPLQANARFGRALRYRMSARLYVPFWQATMAELKAGH